MRLSTQDNATQKSSDIIHKKLADCTGWSQTHAVLIKISVDGCNSVQFDWIDKHTIAVTIQEPTQVASSCNLLAPVRQLSSNSRSARMSFSQVQRVFIVEHYLASHSYLTCQNELLDTFSDSPVSNKPTISRLVNRFRDTGTLHRVAWNTRKRVNSCIAERGGHFFWFHCNLFFDRYNVSGMGCVTFRSPCTSVTAFSWMSKLNIIIHVFIF
jgi:Fe2+ or Zn2+ uptake regulation protein